MNQIEIICLLLLLQVSTLVTLKSQTGSVNYGCQVYKYGLFNMVGVRQSLAYSHKLHNNLSFEITVFTGNGRGNDITQNFQKDYILQTKGNYENLPATLRNEINTFYDGIVSFKRISNGLQQDFGYGFLIHYSLPIKNKLSLDISSGYLVTNTKVVSRENEIELLISDNLTGSLNMHKIFYPAPIYADYNDGFFTGRVNINYDFRERYNGGLSSSFELSPWTSTLNLGFGIILRYRI